MAARSRSRLIVPFVLCVLAVALPPTVTPVAAADAMVRVIHTSPDTPPVDIYVDNTKAITGLGFGAASSYLPLPPGKHDFAVFAANASPASAGPLFGVRGADIPADARLSVVALGLFAEIRTIVVDDKTTAPGAGKAKVRFVHAGTGIPAVDVAAKGGPVLFSNVGFGQQAAYQEVDATPRDLEIRAAGQSTVVASTSIAPSGGGTYSIYLMSLGTVKVFADTSAAPPGAPTTGGPVSIPTTGHPTGNAGSPGTLLALIAGCGAVIAGFVFRRIDAAAGRSR
jgi:Domain of unknown function (DUF4397)